MEIEELQIGDMVQYQGGVDVVKNFAPDYAKIAVVLEEKGAVLQRDAIDVYGLPINEKTLRMFEFAEYKDLDKVPIYLNETEDHELQVYKERINWRVRIQRGAEASISIKAKYIHELQQAMRIMGLKKMAKIYKVVNIN